MLLGSSTLLLVQRDEKLPSLAGNYRVHLRVFCGVLGHRYGIAWEKSTSIGICQPGPRPLVQGFTFCFLNFSVSHATEHAPLPAWRFFCQNPTLTGEATPCAAVAVFAARTSAWLPRNRNCQSKAQLPRNKTNRQHKTKAKPRNHHVPNFPGNLCSSISLKSYTLVLSVGNSFRSLSKLTRFKPARTAQRRSFLTASAAVFQHMWMCFAKSGQTKKRRTACAWTAIIGRNVRVAATTQ